MAVLNILNYPDPRLHTVAKPVKEVDANIRRLIDDMTETMYAAPGIGLAATQVNQHIQLLISTPAKPKTRCRYLSIQKSSKKTVNVPLKKAVCLCLVYMKV